MKCYFSTNRHCIVSEDRDSEQQKSSSRLVYCVLNNAAHLSPAGAAAAAISTCLILFLGGKHTPQVLPEESCSFLCLSGQMGRVHNHQSQISLLHPVEKKANV